MSGIYCANGPCESEATDVVVGNDVEYTPLCATCFSAYSMGNDAGDFAAYPVGDFLEELPHMEDEEDWPEWAKQALEEA